jgi:hypothetical protein
MCGAAWGDFHSEYGNRPVTLFKRDDRAICMLCAEGSPDLVIDAPSLIRMKSLVRRGEIEDQRALLDWLVEKYPSARP